MDDKDKNVIEQIFDKINDVVETVATVAADALSQAMEPDPVKSDQQPISEPTMPLMPVHVPIKGTRAKQSAKKAAKKSPKKAAAKSGPKKSTKTVKKPTRKKVAKKKNAKR
jgi:hypothetical protein